MEYQLNYLLKGILLKSKSINYFYFEIENNKFIQIYYYFSIKTI